MVPLTSSQLILRISWHSNLLGRGISAIRTVERQGYVHWMSNCCARIVAVKQGRREISRITSLFPRSFSTQRISGPNYDADLSETSLDISLEANIGA